MFPLTSAMKSFITLYQAPLRAPLLSSHWLMSAQCYVSPGLVVTGLRSLQSLGTEDTDTGPVAQPHLASAPTPGLIVTGRPESASASPWWQEGDMRTLPGVSRHPGTFEAWRLNIERDSCLPQMKIKSIVLKNGKWGNGNGSWNGNSCRKTWWYIMLNGRNNFDNVTAWGKDKAKAKEAKFLFVMCVSLVKMMCLYCCVLFIIRLNSTKTHCLQQNIII